MPAHLFRALALAVLPFAFSSCLFLGFSCIAIGGAVQTANRQDNACALFSGECCGLPGQLGTYECGVAGGPNTFRCGKIHDTACGCVAPKATLVIGETPRFATYAVPAFTYDVGLPYAGFASAHRLSFDVVTDAYQTFSGAVTFSPGFAFRGFTALGPANTTVGSYGIDLSEDGVADFALPVRAASAELAFADVNGNGQQDLAEPTIQHLGNTPSPGAHTFNLALPAGGDLTPGFARSFTPFRAIVVLSAGVLDNPTSPGSYGVQGTFTSVDPNTGDANDNIGAGPLSVAVMPVAIPIAPSPLELLDHFLCYKSKGSKGSICGAAAAANGGALCTTDADCGGTVGGCVKNKLPKGTQAGLADRFTAFTARTVDVKKALRLCTPADVDGSGRNDTTTHLRGYQVGIAKGGPKPAVTANLVVVNALGTIAVDIKGPDTLYTPAATADGAPAAPLGPHVVDDYQCYKAKLKAKRCATNPARTCKSSLECGADGPCLGKFPKGLQVSVTDRFTGGAKLLDVKKPTRLCAPALLAGSPIQSPDGYLMCYQVKPAAGGAKATPVVGQLHTTDAIARDRIDTGAEDEVCIPSIVPGTPG